jgi:outer membrane protein
MQRNTGQRARVSNDSIVNPIDGVTMKRPLAAAVLAAIATLGAVGTTSALAQDTGDWIVRARALRLISDNDDTTGLNLGVNNKWMPEVDITYFFTPNWAAELILTVPQKHSLYTNGTKIGTLRQLPPTLSLQRHLTDLPGFRPYFGIGINYTRITDQDLVDPVSISKNSWGPAVGFGVDVPVGGGWLVNLDAKKVWIDTDVKISGEKIGTLNIDPWLLSVGVGYRF